MGVDRDERHQAKGGMASHYHAGLRTGVSEWLLLDEVITRHRCQRPAPRPRVFTQLRGLTGHVTYGPAIAP